MDDFKLLGISPWASKEDLKRAYRTMVKANHPDRAADPEEATKRLSAINAAYDRIVAGKPHREREAKSETRTSRSTASKTRPFTADDFQTFDDPPRNRNTNARSERADEPHARDTRAHDTHSRAKAAREQTTGQKENSSAKSARPDASSMAAKDAQEKGAKDDLGRETGNNARKTHPGFERGRRAAIEAYERAKQHGSMQGRPRANGLEMEL